MAATEEKLLPIVYNLEIYENSFGNDPCCFIETAGPFQPIHVGDYLADEALNPQPEVPGRHIFKVIALRHIISTMRSDRVTHGLSVCVKAVPKPTEVF
jgi:hypothetical protein